MVESNLYTRTCPAYDPLASLPKAPIATVCPSLDNATEFPDWSVGASPSISWPIWFQLVPSNLYTRTCPYLNPLSLLKRAPIATILPKLDNDTLYPELS